MLTFIPFLHVGCMKKGLGQWFMLIFNDVNMMFTWVRYQTWMSTNGRRGTPTLTTPTRKWNWGNWLESAQLVSQLHQARAERVDVIVSMDNHKWTIIKSWIGVFPQQICRLAEMEAEIFQLRQQKTEAETKLQILETKMAEEKAVLTLANKKILSISLNR